MPKALVTYYSRTGNTKKMAALIGAALKKEKIQTDVLPVADVKPAMLLSYDAIIIGSPTYYGTCTAEIKSLLDLSVKHHGKLAGKVGGAFASAANIGGGNETTILSILQGLLIHGMIVPGDAKGDHYGPVSIGKPDARVAAQCARFGKIIADLTKKLAG